MSIPLLLLFTSLLNLISAQTFLRIPTFTDVTAAAGLRQPGPLFKWGGPCVADLDNDGIYDLILTHHNSEKLQLFFGTPQGTFQESSFTFFDDIHGVAVAQRSATSRNRLISVSVGGARGANPRPPMIFQVTPTRSITEVSNSLGFGAGAGRGRVTLFMDLALQSPADKRANFGGPDVLFINFLGTPVLLREFAYENVQGEYQLRSVPGIDEELETRAEVIDIDGDGMMEVVSYRDFQIYKLVGPFRFAEATAEFIPNNPIPLYGRSIASVVELDYDNDGDFDLYVARTNNTLISALKPIENDDFSDFLLENRDGVLVDVTAQAGIPRGTLSMGATAGDYNNDGNIDIMLSIWDRPDIILLNQGDGTFRTIQNALPGGNTEVGDHGVAVDYNMDGRLDLIVGRGSQETDGLAGIFHIFMNSMTVSGEGNYLLVRVQNDQRRASTSLHAVVTVFLDGRRLSRRVASSGAQAGGPSYLDTVHFGLGGARMVTRVRVRWTSGVTRSRRDVAANQRINFGVQ